MVSLSQCQEGGQTNHQQNEQVTGELEQLRSELRMETDKMDRQMAQIKQEMKNKMEQMKQEMELKNKQEINKLQLDLDRTRTENSKINNEVYVCICGGGGIVGNHTCGPQ